MSTTSAPTMDRRNTPGPYGEPNADVNAPTRNMSSGAKSISETQSQQPQQSSQSLKSHHSQSQSQNQDQTPSQTQQPTQNQSQPTEENAKGDKQQPAPTSGGDNETGGQSEGDKDVPPGGNDEYPEQLHAGKLEGYGPEYGMQNHTGVFERMVGVKEQLKGTVKRDPELKQKGHDRMTGVLKKKEKEEEEKNDHFKQANDKDDSKDTNNDSDQSKQNQQQDKDQAKSKSAGTGSGEKTKEVTNQMNTGTDENPHSAQSDKAAQEQAKSVRPEGETMNPQEDQGKERQESGHV